MQQNFSVVAAFSADQVAKLTGLTMRQLAYWDDTGFFCPQYAAESRRSPYSRIYSFADLVGLRTVSLLKNGYNVSMAHLKETAERLSQHTDHPWSDIKLAVWNRKITWIDPETGKPSEVVSGQYIMFEMIDVIEDMKTKTVALKTRTDDEYGKIIKARNIAHNRPVFAGTRIPISAVINFADAGFSVQDIIKEYPSLTERDVTAALQAEASSSAA